MDTTSVLFSAAFFQDCISEQDLDEMNIEIIRNTLYKVSLAFKVWERWMLKRRIFIWQNCLITHFSGICLGMSCYWPYLIFLGLSRSFLQVLYITWWNNCRYYVPYSGGEWTPVEIYIVILYTGWYSVYCDKCSQPKLIFFVDIFWQTVTFKYFFFCIFSLRQTGELSSSLLTPLVRSSPKKTELNFSLTVVSSTQKV